MPLSDEQLRSLLSEPTTDLANRVKQKLLTCEETLKEKEYLLYDMTPRFSELTIKYDLKGRTAGYAVYPRTIRINLDILNNPRYQLDMIDDTIPHEYAHIVAHNVANAQGIKEPHHGALWQFIMVSVFSLKPTRCHNYDTVPARNRDQTRYNYLCACADPVHSVSSIIHNKVQNRGIRYHCRRCLADLIWSGQAINPNPPPVEGLMNEEAPVFYDGH